MTSRFLVCFGIMLPKTSLKLMSISSIPLGEKISINGKDVISISLKYVDEAPAIRELKRVSKPSLRKYSSASDLEPVKSGLGLYVLSTSKGLMSDKEAKSQNIGGEVICEVF